ncbi:hypothetical protein [Flavivirga aquatica]|nr:hypothetical protein [Flavivirga aquatica]
MSGGQNLTFLKGDFRANARRAMSGSLWFYDFFGDDHLIPRWFNMIRDNKLRATSIFVSPIIFAQFLGVLGSIFLAYYHRGIKKRKYLILIIVLIALYGVLLSQVRAGFVYFAITFLAIYVFKKFKQNYILLVLVPLTFVFITFFGLIFFKLGDSSSVGRLNQYVDLINNFKIFGYGLGARRAIVYYDSLIISTMMAFGVFSFLYFKVHFTLLKSIFKIEKSQVRGDSINFLGLGLLGSFSAFIYFIFFHYSIGSTPLRFLYFVAFYFMYKIYEDDS